MESLVLNAHLTKVKLSTYLIAGSVHLQFPGQQ